MGQGDPCLRFDGPNHLRLALNTQDGPVAVTLKHRGDEIQADLVGDGQSWIADHLSELIGLQYPPPRFEVPRRLREIAHRFQGMRIPRLPCISARLVQIILQQLVSFRDACHGWRQLVHRFGQPVPGHEDLWFPPGPDILRRPVSHQFVECGILPQHGRRIVEAMRHSSKIEACWNAGRDPESLECTCELMLRIPGIGEWSIGFLRGAGLGDPDAVVLGDYSHPKHVSYFFTGNTTAEDKEMLRLLEPYRPHRFYVLALLLKGSPPAPRQGTRRRSIRGRFR